MLWQGFIGFLRFKAQENERQHALSVYCLCVVHLIPLTPKDKLFFETPFYEWGNSQTRRLSNWPAAARLMRRRQGLDHGRSGSGGPRSYPLHSVSDSLCRWKQTLSVLDSHDLILSTRLRFWHYSSQSSFSCVENIHVQCLHVHALLSYTTRTLFSWGPCLHGI